MIIIFKCKDKEFLKEHSVTSLENYKVPYNITIETEDVKILNDPDFKDLTDYELTIINRAANVLKRKTQITLKKRRKQK